MTNQDFINAYHTESRIISDYYKLCDSSGKYVDLTGIVSPLRVDNRPKMAPTDNQRSTPHCAAYSAATLAESIYWKRTGILKQLDSHQVYALAKQLDNEVYSDGTYLECALHAVINLAAFENSDEIKIGLFYNKKTADTIAETKHLIFKYNYLQAGFNIDEGWYDVTDTNYCISPRGQSLGGHAVNLVGYDQEGVYVLNQWGTDWGAKGYAIMPWAIYLKQLMYGAYLKGAFNEH